MRLDPVANRADTPTTFTRWRASFARRERLGHGALALLVALGLVAASVGCLEEPGSKPRTCDGHALVFDGHPAKGTETAAPSTGYRVEHLGSPGGFFTWSMTPVAAGGSITAIASGADIVTPQAAGTYTVKARSEVLDCELTTSLRSATTTPLNACSSGLILVDLVLAGIRTPLKGPVWLAPGATATLRRAMFGANAVTLTRPSPGEGELVENGAEQWTYTAPPRPGQYRIPARTAHAWER